MIKSSALAQSGGNSYDTINTIKLLSPYSVPGWLCENGFTCIISLNLIRAHEVGCVILFSYIQPHFPDKKTESR